jgi:uncharacterized membrane protein
MQNLIRLLFLTISLTSFGGAVQAGLTICNKADVQHSFAVAFKDGDSYSSKGWWNINPGDCKIVIGGDLKRRYYYFRAIATGREFTGAEYAFCTVQASFDIVGDENCTSRGYDKSLFKKLDTGKSAKDFTLNLVVSDPSAPLGVQAGKYGEPYSDNVVFQECSFRDGANYCAFHGNGTKFFIYDDGRTPQSVLSTLRGFLPGTPISVSGDLVGVYDTTAEVVLREVYERGYDRSDALLEQMQGYWYAVDDANAQFNILGAERENQYDGALSGTEYLSIQESCNEFSGGGPYLYAREEETGEGYCYAIESIGDFEMTLMYLPRGNFLDYRKLD